MMGGPTRHAKLGQRVIEAIGRQLGGSGERNEQ